MAYQSLGDPMYYIFEQNCRLNRSQQPQMTLDGNGTFLESRNNPHTHQEKYTVTKKNDSESNDIRSKYQTVKVDCELLPL